MEKGYHNNYKPSDHSKYDNLIYFRFKALVRSPQYQKFYFSRAKDIDEVIEKKDFIEDEIHDQERSLITMEPDGSFDTPSLEDFLASVNEHGLPNGIDSSKLDDYEQLLRERSDIGNIEEEILSEAAEKFGIIVSDITDLEPRDKHIQLIYVTFQDYLPDIPIEDESMFKGISDRTGAVREVKQDNLSGLAPYLKGGNYKLFLVNTHTPKSLIFKSFQDHFKDHAIKKSERKDFDSWKEAFEVWDMHHSLKLKDVKNHLLATAKAMSKRHPDKPYWQEYGCNTKQNLKTRVNDKLKVASSLIDLAGKGKFKSL